MLPDTPWEDSGVGTCNTYIDSTVERHHRPSFFDGSRPGHGQDGVAVRQLGTHPIVAGDRLGSVSVSTIFFSIMLWKWRQE